MDCSFTKQQVLAMAAVACLLLLLAPPTASASRPMGVSPARVRQLEAQTEGMTECLNALYELRSCTNEIILFFLNGEAHLGVDCCRAVGTITHNCWTAMFASVGFTAEEADILRGYCDASSDTPVPPAAGPVVAPPSPSPTSPGVATAARIITSEEGLLA